MVSSERDCYWLLLQGSIESSSMNSPKKRKPPKRQGSRKSSKTRENSPNSSLIRPNAVPEKRVQKEPEQLLHISGPATWSAGVWLAIALAVVAVVVSYWNTFEWIVDAWIRETDYGHGWLVIPMAIAMCYLRRDRFPGVSKQVAWGGMSLVVLAVAMRIFGRFAYFDFLDGYSVIVLLAGAVWCLLGYRAFLWALPALGFLFFAIPLPFRAESMLSWQLQGVATELSTFFLRAFGMPAVAEGHVVWIGDEKLSIEAACSGLRIFVGMAAFGYFWAAINHRSQSDRIVILASVIPAAVLVNSLRIVLTGLGYAVFESEAMRHLIHDFLGIAMIVGSFLLLGGVEAFWRRLYRPVSIYTARGMLQESKSH